MVLLPPREYLHDCFIPTLGETNAALAEYARAAKDSLLDCNVDKAALRTWREVAEGKPDPTMQ